MLGAAGVPSALAERVSVPVEGSERFSIDGEGRLRPASRGTVVLTRPDLAGLPWTVTGGRGDHAQNLLYKAVRTAHYKTVLRDLALAPRGLAVDDVVAWADHLCQDFTASTSLDSAYALVARRAAPFGDEAREILRALEWLDEVVGDTLGPAATNGVLRVLMLEAVHFVQSEERMEVLTTLAGGTAVEVDPAFRNALQSVKNALRQRRARRLLKLQQIARFGGAEEVPAPASTELPLLPASVVALAYPDLGPERADALGYLTPPIDREGPLTVSARRTREAAATLLATLLTEVLAGELPGCDLDDDEDGALATATTLAHLAAWRYHDLRASLLQDPAPGSEGDTKNAAPGEEAASSREAMSRHVAAMAACVRARASE